MISNKAIAFFYEMYAKQDKRHLTAQKFGAQAVKAESWV